MFSKNKESSAHKVLYLSVVRNHKRKINPNHTLDSVVEYFQEQMIDCYIMLPELVYDIFDSSYQLLV